MSSYILVHIRHIPTQDCEALEYALAMAAFDLPVRLLFSGNGVHWLNKQHGALKDGSKSPSKLLAACSMYEIDHIGLTSDPELDDGSLVKDVTILNSGEVASWMAAAHHVVSF
ncbi:MAG: DsrE family protein [Pseudomonadota bacterium]|nr:DsrE family protein [Pseudomonadota bacterium]MEC8523506.1 DsrE family protein [Pseudomonadota bacterium]